MDASTTSSRQPDILAIARQQLGFQKHVKDASVPKSYLAALRQHLDIDPYDTNFRVTLQPKIGYGVVTCLEQACAAITIPLSARSGRSDGKLDGFGSLANYMVHASTPNHKQARLARVKTLHARKAIKNETPNVLASDVAIDTKPPRGGLLAQLDANLNVNSLSNPSTSARRAPTLKAFGPLPLRRGTAGTVVKPEPADSVIPRKRTSSSLIFLGAENEEDKSGVATPPVSKRTTLQPPKALLALVNSNTKLSQGHIPVQPAHQQAVLPVAHQASLHRSSDETRLRITKIQNDLNSLGKLSTSTKDRTVGQELSAMSFQVLHRNGDDAGYSYTSLNRQPIASGSRVRLDVAMGSGTDSEDDWELPDILGGAGTRDTRFDEDGDFYGRGKDLFVGPTANPGDIDKFLIAAGNAEQFDGNASVDKALEKLGLKSLYDLLPGMAISLLAHQVIGVAWALEREKCGDRGGCLSDEMGLGKTVQIISVVVANPSDDPRCKTNLIVAPLALLDQWKLEIEMKTTNNLKCLVYHGPNKPRKKTDLMKYDVVLTTYHTLALEWPDLEAEEKAKQKAQKRKKIDSFIESDSGDIRKPKKSRELGLLFQVQWYRVILDEAQNIRNRRTRISRSVTDLDTTYRWCLTGTPIINGLVDAYALFRFLRFRPWYDWQEFNGHVSIIEKKNPELASKRLQAIFISIMLRRKKDSMLDGKRLIELPTKHVEMEKLEFSKEELEIYQMVEARSQARFNRFLRAGTVLKNYHQVLVMLLRLRQVCSHPALIQETSEALVAADQLVGGLDLKAELARAARLVSSEFVTKLKAKYLQCALARIQAEKESLDATAEGEECPICMDTFTEARVTACGHTFCRECIANVLNAPFVQDMEDPRKYRSNEKPCPSCRAPISADAIFIREAFEPTNTELSGDASASSDDEMPEISDMMLRGTKGKNRARRIRKKRAVYDSDDESEDDDDDDDISDFIVEDGEDEAEKDARRDIKKRLRKRRAIVVESDDELDADEREVVIGRSPRKVPASIGQVKMMSRFLPSTKMNHMMEHLEKWAKQNPGDKTIIISQWTECLKLVSDFLAEKKIPHVKYQGSMSRSQRDQAVRAFMMGNTAQVMLMSLKCGGVGLNLTRANRVISLDLGWSEAIESQAFDRVHRLGQQKDVFVHRLVIANTVEDRVLALQERKRNLADGSLGEGSGKKIGRMSVRELANLFGLDHRGNLL